MAGTRAYLDHNASTPLRPAAAEAMTRALRLVGNPSSVHAEGRQARAALDAARLQVARAVNGDAKNVIFTSGATEALNTLLRPSPLVTLQSGAKRTDRLLVMATEHSSVLAGGSFTSDRIDELPVELEGFLRIAPPCYAQTIMEIADRHDGVAPVTVAVQLANSETGVTQPIDGWAEVAHKFGSIFVTDAVAAFGKIPIDIKRLGVDALVLSAHKFGGPKGVGAIVLNGDRLRIEMPLLNGGGQEKRRRSGTENVAGIVAMGVAAEEAAAAVATEAPRLAMLRDRLEASFLAGRPDAVIFGTKAPRLPNTLNIAVPGLKAETAVIAFDLANVSISSGSACSSGKVKRSHVLDAMGVDPALAECALRFSLGWTTTEDDIAMAESAFARIAANARGSNSSLAAA